MRDFLNSDDFNLTRRLLMKRVKGVSYYLEMIRLQLSIIPTPESNLQ